jgi:hypothetical protein
MRQRVYRVITAPTIEDLETRVSQLFERNEPELIGGVTCVQRRSGEVIWAQAVMCWY